MSVSQNRFDSQEWQQRAYVDEIEEGAVGRLALHESSAVLEGEVRHLHLVVVLDAVLTQEFEVDHVSGVVGTAAALDSLVSFGLGLLLVFVYGVG